MVLPYPPLRADERDLAFAGRADPGAARGGVVHAAVGAADLQHGMQARVGEPRELMRVNRSGLRVNARRRERPSGV